MFNYFRNKFPSGVHFGEAKTREKSDFFQFQKAQQHGFPAKPSCLAYDSSLNLIAIGTKTGFIKVYGAPGVEFAAEHANASAVQKIHFLPNQGRMLSICEDGTVHLWEVNFREDRAYLDHKQELRTDGRMKKITSSCLNVDENGNGHLLIGTESGNVYQLDLKSFDLTDLIIYQESIIQSIPEDFKFNAGAIEAMVLCPSDSNELLLAYRRGLFVLWDIAAHSVVQTFSYTQQVEHAGWLSETQFGAAHNDGSFTIWKVGQENFAPATVQTPYGPYPCTPITKISWQSIDTATNADATLTVFSGGMPRATYSDRHTVAVKKGEKDVVFDVSSKVIDFVVISKATTDDNSSVEPMSELALCILCEEEFVAIDLSNKLSTEAWIYDIRPWRNPYLYCLHSSPITASQHFCDISESVWNKLVDAGRKQLQEMNFSTEPWPIQGGKNRAVDVQRDLLVTGHEDGTVKFWNSCATHFELVYVLQTASVFEGFSGGADLRPAEDEWPPFRKVGVYDPFSDDPRFGVQRVAFDVADGILVVGGTAGQVLTYDLIEDDKEVEFLAVNVEVVTERENFVWRGHEPLEPLSAGAMTFRPGFAVKSLLQLNPPAACTALALNKDCNVIAVGTAHGFAVFDYAKKKSLLVHCTLVASDVLNQTVSSDGAMSRFKSLKKSLRQSFRVKRRRPQSPPVASPTAAAEDKERSAQVASPDATAATSPTGEDPNPSGGEVTGTATGVRSSTPIRGSPTKVTASPAKKESSPKKEPVSAAAEAAELARPIERSIEARTENDTLGSLVRVAYFADTYILNATTTSRTLWIGTHAGAILVYVLTPSEADKAETEEAQVVLAKEIQLRHHAPVMAISVVDPQNFSLDKQQLTPVKEEQATPSGTEHHGHKVIICSEEQLKSFHLPTLKPGRHKFKLTATEGSRVRKVQFVSFQSRSDDSRWESFVTVLTNLGNVQAFSMHNFKRFLNSQCTKRDDLPAINSAVLTKRGEGFYALSSSEFQRFSLSSRFAGFPCFSLELPEGSREVQAPVSPPTAPTSAEPGPDGPGPQTDLINHVETEDGANVGAESSAADDTVNTSALVSDVTMDSIRDYTGQQEHAGENNVASIVVTTKFEILAETKLPAVANYEANQSLAEKILAENGSGSEDEIATEKLRALKMDSEKIETSVVE